jgi:hypothetical protein
LVLLIDLLEPQNEIPEIGSFHLLSADWDGAHAIQFAQLIADAGTDSQVYTDSQVGNDFTFSI